MAHDGARRIAGEIEVRVIGEHDGRGAIGAPCRDLEQQRVVGRETHAQHHAHGAGEALLAGRRLEAQLQRVALDSFLALAVERCDHGASWEQVGIPESVREAARAAVQAVRAVVGRELMALLLLLLLCAEHERGVGDAPRHTAAHGTKVRRIREVLIERIEAEHHVGLDAVAVALAHAHDRGAPVAHLHSQPRRRGAGPREELDWSAIVFAPRFAC